MTNPPYEYRGLMAESWDAFRGDTSDWSDRPLYREAIARFGEPALDVGCATGRLLLDYLAQGVDIDGLDNSPEMLAICREKADSLNLAPALYEQSLETMDLPRRYGTILIPSSSLQLLLEPEQVAGTLERVYAHLLPGGALVASIMTLWQPGDPLEETTEAQAEGPAGVAYRRVAHTRYDPATALEHTDTLYQRMVDGAVTAKERHVQSPATRSYTQDEIRALFASAGYDPVTLYSGFFWEPVRPEDRLWVVVATRGRRRLS